MSRAALKEQRRQQERQHEEQDHRQLRQAAAERAEQPSKEWIESITETNLDAATISHLQNLLSKDFVLGKISPAEKDELKWLARNIALRITTMHPFEESVFKGEYRKVLFDDEDEGFRPLSSSQEEEIKHVILAFFVRESRSEGGWQQEEFGKFYAVTEKRDEESDKGVDGLLPGRR